MDLVIGFAVVVAGLWLLVKLAALISSEVCPRCGARAATYRHTRKDGKPDLRYKHNPLDCTKCGLG